MKFARISKALVGLAVLALTSAVVSADVINKKTTLTVNETIEVPGAVLEPGEYVVKLVDSQSNRHIVRFFNKDETEVLATVMAFPNERMQRTGETEFGWHETPAGQPPALKAWFYPGDVIGQEFAYPEGRATELTEITKQEVAHISEDEAAKLADQVPEQEETVIAQAPASRPNADNSAAENQAAQQARERETAAQQARERETSAQQARERETAAQRERDMQAQRDRERQTAQATQDQQRNADPSLTAQQDQQRNADSNATAQQNQQSTTTGNELPQTAGLGVLLALIGLGALGASRAVRKLRNK